jgi:hypothetical protein
MNINRHNYEAYFLLYVDNELSQAEMDAVDAFANCHPDLAEELVMLQQSVAKPDNIKFDAKEKLLTQNGIPASLQEKLLLYLDNECTRSDTAIIESLLQQDSTAAHEWTILQQTKLDKTEQVFFAHKEGLYKKESGKIVAIRWWRLAAAAIVIGFGIFGTVHYFNTNTPQTNLAANQPAATKKATATTTIPTTPVTQNANTSTAIVNQSNTIAPDTTIVTPLKKQLNIGGAESNFALNKNDKKTTTPQIPAVTTTATQQPLENINNNGSNNTTVSTVTPQKQEATIAKLENNINSSIPAEIQPNKLAVPAVYKQNTDSDDDTYASNDDDNRRGRTKLGAFFKKVKRTIERKTNTANSDDEIKIANLSFAVH